MKKEVFIKAWSYISALLVIGVIIYIFSYILIKGYGVISFEFLFGYPKGMPLGTEGGIFPAIVGSLYLGIICAVGGGLLSVATAIYLAFYCKNKFLYEFISFSIQSISGVPSIILGLFGYSFLIMKLGISKGLISAGITLSIMIVPFITLRVEKHFREFSKDIIDASLALGVSKIYTITNMILKRSIGKIISTITLAVAYAIGAAAPIMFTGVAIFAKVPNSISDPFMALPYHLYILVNEGLSTNMAYGTAFVLIVIIVVINLLCQFLWKEESYNGRNN